MALRFMRALNERIYQADEWMSLLSLMEVEQRLASVLLLFNNRVRSKDGRFKLPITKRFWLLLSVQHLKPSAGSLLSSFQKT